MNHLDVFGRLVMERLRDESIDFCDLMLRKHWKAPGVQKLQAKVASMPPQDQDTLLSSVRASVDEGIHSFLVALREAIESGEIQLLINGSPLLDLSDQLEGELFSEDGWQARFSRYGEAPESD